jgi:NAD(P)H-dependent FMN reductase
MKQLLIIWHSRTGSCAQLAQAMLTAVQALMAEHAVHDAHVLALRAADATAEAVLAADALIFVCPENLASMSGAMKEFFDLHYYALLDQINGKAYAAVIAAGSDGTGALRQLERIVSGWRLKKVAGPIIVCTQAQTAAEIHAEKILPETELARARAVALDVAGHMLWL